jgi:hypothetical protein
LQTDVTQYGIDLRRDETTPFRYNPLMGRVGIDFTGALVKEQGLVFAVVEVSGSVIDAGDAVIKKERERYEQVFRDVPIILASKAADGRVRYVGRPDIAKFLANAGWARIPWKRYRAKRKDKNPFRDWA